MAFRNFKALRNTGLQLAPFNLVIGPNGSGKTSLIQALLRLRDLSTHPISAPAAPSHAPSGALEITFHFSPPYADLEARLSCSGEFVCDLLQVSPPAPERWNPVRGALARIRCHVLDHVAMTRGSARLEDRELAEDGSNVAAVLASRRTLHPKAFQETEKEFCRLLPEFARLDFQTSPEGNVQVYGVLVDGGRVAADALSQGTLYVLALLTLAFDAEPPSVLCIEEIDRGIHPRMLREIRDLLYRLSYPSATGGSQAPVQVIATTHSPYVLDLFREHPEEVVIAQKQGSEAWFERLSDRADIGELLKEGPLGDMWFAGILGGVPEEGGVSSNPPRSDGSH